MYRLLKKTSSIVQPISCDEAFMDITGLGDDDQIVSALRAKIEAATGVTASAGIGPNMLLARLATKRAKPNGQFNISLSQVSMEVPSKLSTITTMSPQKSSVLMVTLALHTCCIGSCKCPSASVPTLLASCGIHLQCRLAEVLRQVCVSEMCQHLQADEELLKLRVGDLPGVGWAMQKKLEEKLGITSVADVRTSRRDVLQRELGAKSGSMVSHPQALHLGLPSIRFHQLANLFPFPPSDQRDVAVRV